MRHLAQRVVLYLLRGYKRYLSPMFPPACRYVPTCSEYAMEAVERYGALRGSLMAAARLLRQDGPSRQLPRIGAGHRCVRPGELHLLCGMLQELPLPGG